MWGSEKQYKAERSNTLSFAIRDQSGVDLFILSIHYCPVVAHSCSFPYCGIDKRCSTDATFNPSHVTHDSFCLCTKQRNTRTTVEASHPTCTKHEQSHSAALSNSHVIRYTFEPLPTVPQITTVSRLPVSHLYKPNALFWNLNTEKHIRSGRRAMLHLLHTRTQHFWALDVPRWCPLVLRQK